MGSILPFGATSSHPAPGSIVLTIFLQTASPRSQSQLCSNSSILSLPPSITRTQESSSLCSPWGSSSTAFHFLVLQHAGRGLRQGFCNRSEMSQRYDKSTISLCLPMFSDSFTPSWKLLNNLLNLTFSKKRKMKTPASELLSLSPSRLFFLPPTRNRKKRICTSFLRSWLLF